MHKLSRIIRSSAFILFSFALLIALMKFRTYDEPIERDIGIYATIASEIKHGKILYKDVWDVKTPALYFTYLLFELIFSKGELQIYALQVSFSILLMLGIYFASFELTNSKLCSYFAALAYTIISGDLVTQANQPNAELFINFSFVWAIFFYLRGVRKSQYKNFLLAGIFCALASMYKQYSFILAVALLCDYLLFRRKSLKDFLYIPLLLFMPTILFFSGVSLYFYFHDALIDFIDVIFLYPFYYIADSEKNGSWLEKIFLLFTNFHKFFILPIWTFLPLVLANFAVICFTLKKRDKDIFIILLISLATILMVVAPWKFYAHYYQLLIPPLCIGFAYAISKFSFFDSFRAFSFIKVRNLACIILITCFILQAPNYFMPSEWWSYKKYGPIFLYCREIGREISTLINEDETFFQWGYEGSLYFYAKRRPATGRFFNIPFIFSPQKEKYTRKTIEEFERKPPALIVLPRHYSTEHPLIVWILKHYEPVHNINERRQLEEAMVMRASEMFKIDKPILLQSPITPPMYFYKPKSDLTQGF